MNKPTIAILAILFALIGCKKDDPFPEPTQDGRNTFGVMINGQKWLPVQGHNLLGAPEKVSGGYQYGNCGITARKGVNDEVIVLIIRNIKSTGVFPLNAETTGPTDASIYYGHDVDDDYYLNPLSENNITLTRFDTLNRIISGTFKCQFKGSKNQQTKDFTNGVFDVKYDE